MTKQKNESAILPGALVSFPVGRTRLDGFWRSAEPRRKTLLIYVHGMHGRFYGSRMKDEILGLADRGFADVLSFNNRGTGEAVATERFADARADLDAAIQFGRCQGYCRFILAGHSTGCQKGLYYLDRTRNPDVRGLILLAPCDDYAITRHELGRRYSLRVRTARERVASGKGEERMPSDCRSFSARRFLSVADRAQTEASLFDYDGPMRAWRRLQTPTLVLFGTREEYAVLTPREMIRRLAGSAATPDFESVLLRGADHGFHGRERETAEEIALWCSARTGGRLLGSSVGSGDGENAGRGGG
ncbi:MAG: alpha/beta fold hydrolase [Kiritimatiellia bacterium]|nr:alpha/beta fold hydrolase [Kiritimatiellia bacterium]